MSTVKFGQLNQNEIQAVDTAPASAAARIEGQTLSSTHIQQLFRDVDLTSFVMPFDHGVTCDASTNDALGRALGGAMVLEHVSFANCGRMRNLDVSVVAARAVQDSFTIKVLDLTNAGIDSAGARVLARGMPANRTVQDWVFANNEAMGDDGANYICEALARTQAQRVSFRNCGIGNVPRLVQSLSKLTTLVAVDMRNNPGYEPEMLTSGLQSQLQRNAGMLYPRSKLVAEPFTDRNDAAGAGGGASAGGRGGGGRDGDGTDAGTENEEGEEFEEGTEYTETAGGGAHSMSRSEFEYSLRRWRRKDETFLGNRRSLTPSTSRFGSGLSPMDRMRMSLKECPIRENSATRDLQFGMEDYREVREHYDEYIRAGNRPEQTVEEAHRRMRERALKKPTFVMGKRVANVEGKTSAPFRGRPVHTRVASPRTIQRSAPWITQPVAQPGAPTTFVPSSVGNKVYVEIGRTKEGDPIYSCVEDGGEQTYLDPLEDPRDMGTFARRIQMKKEKPKEPWRRSHTMREVRFAQDQRSRSFVQREASAPDPGAYKAEDEWQLRARKLKEKHKPNASTGRPVFGGTATPRQFAARQATTADCSIYEIP